MSKIKEKAEKWLNANNANEVHATSDGFLFVNKHLAKNHSKTLKNKEVETFTSKGQPKTPNKPKPRFLDKTVDEMADALPEIDDLGMLEAFLNEEQNQKDPRKTAIELIQERINEVTQED